MRYILESVLDAVPPVRDFEVFDDLLDQCQLAMNVLHTVCRRLLGVWLGKGCSEHRSNTYGSVACHTEGSFLRSLSETSVIVTYLFHESCECFVQVLSEVGMTLSVQRGKSGLASGLDETHGFEGNLGYLIIASFGCYSEDSHE